MKEQQRTASAEPQFAALLAIDWADQKHTWAWRVPGSSQSQQGELENSPEAIEEWAAELAQRFAGRPIAVALEQARGAVIAVLSKYEHLILYPVPPTMSAHYRKSFQPSGAKSDSSDTAMLLDLLTRHRDKLRPWQPDTVETRTLQILVEERRKLVDDKTAYHNRLTAWLKQIFPQILRWFDDCSAPIVGELLERWPTLPQLQAASPDTLRDFFHQHHSRSEERIAERLRQIQSAVPVTRDPALLAAGGRSVQSLLQMLTQLRQAIAGFDQQIRAVAQAHPDLALMKSLPGAGPVMAPRLIAVLGTNRDRFDSAAHLQCFTGVAPVIEASGNQRWVHWRWACPKFVRQTICEWAQHSMKKCQWAREFYQHQRANNKSHHAAIRALAFKWLRILFRCWKDRKPYDPAVYECSRRRRLAAPDSPPSSSSPVKIQWKSVAGFFKPDGFSA